MKMFRMIVVWLGLTAGVCAEMPQAEESVQGRPALQTDEPVHEEFKGLQRELMQEQVQSIEQQTERSQPDRMSQLIDQLRSLEIPEKVSEPNEPIPVPADQKDNQTAPIEILPDEQAFVELDHRNRVLRIVEAAVQFDGLLQHFAVDVDFEVF